MTNLCMPWGYKQEHCPQTGKTATMGQPRGTGVLESMMSLKSSVSLFNGRLAAAEKLVVRDAVS